MADERATECGTSAVLYKRLLALASSDEPEPLLADVAQLLVELSRAQILTVELIGARSWCWGEGVEAKSAAICCTPIGEPHAIGFITLHGRTPFTKLDEERLALVAHAIDQVAVHLLARSSLREQMLRLQRRVIFRALIRHRQNLTETARALGIARSHLYRLLRTHGLRSLSPS